MDRDHLPLFTRKLDWRSACLFMLVDPEWKDKIRIGGWVLLIPIIGWPAVLGYRKEAIARLVNGSSPILPDWRAGLFLYVREGFKAILVINGWFLPAFFWVAIRITQSPYAAEFPWVWLIVFFLVSPIFSTFAVPVIITVARYGLTEPAISLPESLAISALFIAATFVIPAGFLNVSRTGRYLSAFHIPTMSRTISNDSWEYMEAWIGSSIISLIGHFCIPLSPWGVVWAYLAIVYFFNEIPARRHQQSEFSRLKESWFPVMQSGYWDRFETAEDGVIRKYVANNQTDAGKLPHAFTAVVLGPVWVPIK